MSRKHVSCVAFVRDVLDLEVTPAWRVLLTVAVDGVAPASLDAGDRELAHALFGDVDEVPQLARRVLVWLLGRASGKSTFAAAVALWLALTAQVAVGPGDVPTVAMFSIDRATATIALRMARELARRRPEIERLIDQESAEGFHLRRPDGVRVAFAVFAAARAGASARGRTFIAAILDESCFFRSEAEGGYLVTDDDVVRAVMPRLRGPLLLVSTPWPTETLTSRTVDANYGAPSTALVAKGRSLDMRPGDEGLRAAVAAERARDPENAAREFDLVVTGSGTSAFFDAAAIDAATDPELPIQSPPPWRDPRPIGARHRRPDPWLGAGVDPAFRSDSATLAIIVDDRDESCRRRVAYTDELRPQRGSPLQPSAVVRHFAETLDRFGIVTVASDGFYIESVREHFRTHGVRVREAPAGNTGKVETYVDFRNLLHEGRIRLPRHERLRAQLRAIIARPLAGGGLQITAPRRAGGGHGDLVSAVVLANWAVDHRPPVWGTRWEGHRGI